MTKYITLSIALFININSQAQSVPDYQNTTLDFETRALDLVQQMTLDEKISQMGNSAPAIPRLNIQAYDWWNEALHGVARAGVATVFPQAIGLAATFDTELMLDIANVISDEARAKHHEALRNNDFGRYKGLTYWSPNINIFRDPRWGRGHETYGEDPYLTGQMGMQFVKGLQGDDPKYLKLVATAKHFAVHNGPEPDRHSFNAVPNSRDLWETYLPAFKDLMVDAKAYSIMGAYNRLDGESASASWMLLEDILRDKWAFEGFVVSDCGAIRDIYMFHKIVNTAEEAAAIGVRRGNDLNCGGVYQSSLRKALEDGLIDEGEIDRSLYRLILARMKLGMFDSVDEVPYAQIPFEINDSNTHDELALEAARKSITLLKNDGILPLNKKEIKRIAVIGPNANSVAALLANYHGEPSNPVTVIDGLRKIAGTDVEITFSEGVPLVIDEINTSDYSVINSKYLFTTDESGNEISGLKGEYYSNMMLEGDPLFTKVDEEINFNWASSPTTTEVAQGILTPDKAIGNDNFSVRWTGKLLVPKSGKYKIGTVSDDGSRLWINGEKITDGWSDHAMEPFFTEMDLVEGEKYDIKIEFYENSQGAGILLGWEIPENETIEEVTDPLLLSQRILKEVKDADVAIFVGGLDATWEGEEMSGRSGIEGFNRGDRTKIELPETQLNALKSMKETGTPVIFVPLVGSALSFNGLEEDLDAILLGWYPGQRGGDAIAEVLFGEYNPAGRLPVTFYSSTDELADFSDYNMRAGKGFTYRYYTGEPLFPFGHGLSYTEFEYTNLKFDKVSISENEELSVSVTVKNIGEKDGEEVVQLYIRDIASDTWMPIKQLRKFERISLNKGESKVLNFKLDPNKDFIYYNSMLRKYMVEPGEFEVQIGASSEDIRLSEIITINK